LKKKFVENKRKEDRKSFHQQEKRIKLKEKRQREIGDMRCSSNYLSFLSIYASTGR
jgi:hypothetical protein